MVTIGSLRYDIVADTSKFTQGMVSTRSELAAAKRLFMETRTPAEKLAIAQSGLENAFKKGAISQETYNRSMSLLGKSTQQAVAPINNLSTSLGTLVKGYIALQGVSIIKQGVGKTLGLATRGLDLAASAELARADFAALVGSEARGALLADQLNRYATTTTLETGSVLSTAQQLLSFGVEVDRIIPNLKMLGDIAGGDSERMSGLALAFGQATSLGRLQREEVNQMIERGFNPMQYIVKLTGETMEELSDRMKRGGVSASELVAAMELATSKGERFFDRVNAKAETFRGQMDLLRDDFDLLLRDLAAFGIEPGKQSAQAARGVLQDIRQNPGGLITRGISAVLGTVAGQGTQNTFNAVSKMFGVSDIISGGLRGKSLDEQVKTVVAANVEEMNQQLADTGTGGAFTGIRDFAASFGPDLKAMATVAGQAALNAGMGIGSQVLLRSQLEGLEKQMSDLDKKKTPTVAEMPGLIRKGSREEFQFLSQKQRGDEEKKLQKQHHKEAQEKRDALIAAMNAIREKLDMPILLPGI